MCQRTSKLYGKSLAYYDGSFLASAERVARDAFVFVVPAAILWAAFPFRRFKEPPCCFKFARPPLPFLILQEKSMMNLAVRPQPAFKRRRFRWTPRWAIHPSRARPRTCTPHLRLRIVMHARQFAVYFIEKRTLSKS